VNRGRSRLPPICSARHKNNNNRTHRVVGVTGFVLHLHFHSGRHTATQLVCEPMSFVCIGNGVARLCYHPRSPHQLHGALQEPSSVQGKGTKLWYLELGQQLRDVGQLLSALHAGDDDGRLHATAGCTLEELHTMAVGRVLVDLNDELHDKKHHFRAEAS